MLPTKLDSRKAKAHRYACHLSQNLRHFDAYLRRVQDGKCSPRVRQNEKARLKTEKREHKAYLAVGGRSHMDNRQESKARAHARNYGNVNAKVTSILDL